MVYPTNVLHLATEYNNKEHSAVFPEVLPEWFIKLFTKEEDWVLDPFLGSGTTSVVAQLLNRHSIGIELMDVYYQRACERVGKTPASSLNPGVWAPRAPCSLAACPVESHPCMDAISPSAVVQSILAALDR